MAESVRVDLEDIYGEGQVPSIKNLQKDLLPTSPRTDIEKEMIRIYLRNKKK